jgi:lipid II:glycine glycyltransferase (peptidoglycan interpeptide bridge formation enzyme)
MQLIAISPSDRDEYNEYIESVDKGHVFQLYEWGELKATTGWEPLRYVVKDSNRIVGAISILKRKIPGLNKYIFYAPRGPVCDLNNKQVLDFLWKEIKKIAKKHKAIFFKIDPDVNTEDENFKEHLLKSGFKKLSTGKDFDGIQPRFVFRLNLDKSADDLLADMASKTRYNIRYAKRKGVNIKENCDLNDLEEFYNILEVTADRDEFGIRNYEYFKSMWKYLIETGYGKLFMAEFEGRYIAGTLALICGNKVWYSYGASDNVYRNKQPNYLLQWTMINWAIENDCEVYDFRGVSGDLSEDNPLYGLYRFKKGFNGDFTEFIGEYDLVINPLFYQLWVNFMPTAKKYRTKILKLIRG